MPSSENLTSNVDYCPRCGSAGQPVGFETVAFYLSKETQKKVADPLNFCPLPRCDVVYFDAFERVILKGELGQTRLSQRSRCPDLRVLRIDQVTLNRTWRKEL